MFRLSSLRFALLAAALSLPVAAQVQVFGGTGSRMASTKIFFDKALVGMICVQFGQPEWKDSYDGMMDKLKGKQLRLGKDFWTTLNNTIPMDIGGVSVAPGSWYLGLHCDDKGAFSLLVIDQKPADEAGWGPFMPGPWKATYTVPLTMAATDKVQELMLVEINGEDAAKLTFEVHWGMHKLSAPVVAHLAGEKKGADADAHAKHEAASDGKKK
ncbi:MAG: hypothetical protein U1F36_19680 [Planctomycetota bacterium]